MSDLRAIVALSEAELADFFPGDLWRELRGLFPNLYHVGLPLAHPHLWQKLLSQNPPEILISGWKTPSLPPDLTVAVPHSLAYVCHVTGTVRKFIPRQLIERGLLVTNWGNSISRTVSECALMLTLMALRRASYWSIAMHREGAWKTPETCTHSLFERRVGIHGFGSIAQNLVPLLKPFTKSISAFSPQVPDEIFHRHGVRRLGSLQELFSTSEVVIELAAATPENQKIVTEELLRLLPADGVFVNVGRGSVVDEDALLRVARDGKIQIALDVFETEPLPADSPLRGLPNVTLLPHLGGPTKDRRRDSGALALKNLRAYLKGEPMEAVVSLEVYDRSS